MNKRDLFSIAFAFALCIVPLTSAAAQVPATTAAEQRFVAGVARDLTSRFATTADAARAGYVRYTNEDETGAVNWVNAKYWKSDPQHPSQVWYDVHGRLLGADFSVLKADSDAKPRRWGVGTERWLSGRQHVHFGVRDPSGAIVFGAAGSKKIRKVGGDPDHPTAADIVKLGRAKRASDVAFVVVFPPVWDLEVWVIPNPSGPFEDANPNVKPSHPGKGM